MTIRVMILDHYLYLVELCYQVLLVHTIWVRTENRCFNKKFIYISIKDYKYYTVRLRFRDIAHIVYNKRI